MRLFDLQMTPKEIERAVTLGWGSALLCSVGSLLVAFMLPGFGVPPSEATVIRPAMGAVAFAVLAYCVYRRWSFATGILVFLFAGARVWGFVHHPSVINGLVSIALLFCFLAGLRGVLAHRRAASS